MSDKKDHKATIFTFDSIEDAFNVLNARASKEEQKYDAFYKGQPGYRLDEKVTDFICISFTPGMSINPAFLEMMQNWKWGDVRGYVNCYNNLCINFPLPSDEIGEDGDEKTAEGADLFAMTKATGQERYDFESANLGCWMYPFNYLRRDGKKIITKDLNELEQMIREEQPEMMAFAQAFEQIPNVTELVEVWNIVYCS